MTRPLTTIGILVALAGIGTSGASASDSAAPVRGPVRLLSGDARLVEPGEISASALLPGRGEDRFLLRFDGPLTDAQREALRESGVRLVQYVNGNAHVARLDPGGIVDLDELGFVVGGAPYQTSWKVSGGFEARRFTSAARQDLARRDRCLLRVHMFRDATEAEIDRAARVILARPQGQLFRTSRVGGNAVLAAEIDTDGVAGLAALRGVQFIEHAPEISERNSTAQGIVQSGTSGVTPLHDAGLTGLGQVVGICDSGLDQTHCAFTTPPGKLIAFNGTPTSTLHGTHVSGIAVGNDAGNLQGHAFDAGFVFSIEPGFTFTDLTTILELQASQSARVHTNSWGDDNTNEYTGLARAVDSFMHGDEDQLVVFAVTNTATLKSPENAKNCISVAASKDTPNIDDFCYGGSGLTADQRLKPDVFAPGCNIVSAGAFTGCGIQTLSGTSMATPAVAGVASLMRQYFTDGYYPTGAPNPPDGFTPSGALLKATMVNSATGMSGIPDLPSAQSSFTGWGRIVADSVAFFPGDTRALYVEDIRNQSGLMSGSAVEHSFDVLGSTEPLTVTVCWTDAPPAPGSAIAWVNDLNLEVIAPDGTTYLGNNFSAGASVPGGAPDTRNNAEQVHVLAPDAGSWTVRISGASVPEGPQGYALVATGELSPPPRPLTITAVDPPTVIAPATPPDSFDVLIEEQDDLLLPGTAMLHYRYAGATWSAVALTPQGGGLFRAELPSASCGHTPEFYVSAEGLQTGMITAPPSGPSASFGAVVGTTTQSAVLSEGFDTGLPAGWSVSGLWHATAACENLPLCGTAPWLYFGDDVLCGYGTGIREQGTLTAAPLVLPAIGAGEELTLRYCSSMDNENVVFWDRGIVRADGALLEEAPHSGGAWQTRDLDLSAFSGQSVSLTWNFDTIDQFSNNFGGWQIDDVMVLFTELPCTDPCPGDVDGNSKVDVFDFGAFAIGFGTAPNATRSHGDFDGDGETDVFDFGVLATHFGDVCDPP